MKSGTVRQTTTYNNYVNLKKFLKHNKVPFNLLKSVSAQPYNSGF
jgi:hypothetical protein